MRVARRFVPVIDPDGTRRLVHLRTAGSGPPLLLVHQSPRSSAEFAPLFSRWAEYFTLIAPDTPGFGESQPLHHPRPEVEDYADALIRLLDTLGLAQVGAYGFHSGAIILVTAARRHPGRLTALGAGGYAVWTEDERSDFDRHYTPDFLPSAQGEHLAWAWGRVLEQGWFFPWYRFDDRARLPHPHADPERIHPIVLEMLGSGNAFSLGYAAVLRARRDLPEPDETTQPTLIAAFDGDPLQAHLDRLGPLPRGWQTARLADAEALEAAMLAHLRAHPAPPAVVRWPSAEQGFVAVERAGFRGEIHWRGDPRAERLLLHAPGSATDACRSGSQETSLALDLPGHGLSAPWPQAPETLDPWAEAVAAALEALEARPLVVVGEGWSGALAQALGPRIGAQAAPWAPPRGDRVAWAARGLPDLTPDRDGLYLLKAWRAVRAAVAFEPWFDPAPGHERAFLPAEVEPQALAARHLALLRANAARPLLKACLGAKENDDGNP